MLFYPSPLRNSGGRLALCVAKLFFIILITDDPFCSRLQSEPYYTKYVQVFLNLIYNKSLYKLIQGGVYVTNATYSSLVMMNSARCPPLSEYCAAYSSFLINEHNFERMCSFIQVELLIAHINKTNINTCKTIV